MSFCGIAEEDGVRTRSMYPKVDYLDQYLSVRDLLVLVLLLHVLSFELHNHMCLVQDKGLVLESKHNGVKIQAGDGVSSP